MRQGGGGLGGSRGRPTPGSGSFQVGLLLAQGMRAEQAVQSMGHVAEGAYSAHTVLARARTLGVDMPITRCVVGLLDGSIDAERAARFLMERDAKTEHG